MGNSTDEDAFLHSVTVNDFYMSKNLIFYDEWMNLLNIYPIGYEDEVYGELPKNMWKGRFVENITWYDAISYCNKRSKAEGLTPCYASDGSKDLITNCKSIRIEFQNVTCDWNANGYRLPTEAEWEYAMSTDKRFQNWNSKDFVYEWCWDYYDKNYYKVSQSNENPLGPSIGEIHYGARAGKEDATRVLRQGGKYYKKGKRDWALPCTYNTLAGPIPFSFRVVKNYK